MTHPSGSLSKASNTGAGREAHAKLSLAVALLGFFVITLDALVVSVALPAIAVSVGGGISGLQWVIDGYTLMFAALLMFSGTMSDRIGARKSFALGLFLFVASSVACALAPDLVTLVGARLLQGTGAAIMTPASLALVREAYPESAARARAIGIWALGGAVAAASGPLVGGALSLVSWRLIFIINVPVGLAILVLLRRVPTSPLRRVPFDWVGQVTVLLAMVTLIYAVIEGGRMGFDHPIVLAAFATSIAAAATFVVSQTRGRHPMVPPQLVTPRPVAVSIVAGFAFMVGYFGMVFLLSIYLQQERGLNSLETGFVFLPMTLLVSVMNLVSPRAAARFGPRVPVAVGLSMMAVGLASLALAIGAPTVHVMLMAVLIMPVGLGGALAMPAVTAVLLDNVPQEQAGTASAVLNTSRQVGGALAVAIFGALIAHQGLTTGTRSGLLIAAALVLVTTGISLTLDKGPVHAAACSPAAPRGQTAGRPRRPVSGRSQALRRG